MFGALYVADGTAAETLAAVAREFSPRLEICGDREVLIDLSGLTRLFGDAREIANELRREAADRGLFVRAAVASTRTTARLMAHHRAGITVVDAGCEAGTLAPLPIDRLAHVTDIDLQTLRRWGIQTLGALAALPSDAVAARLGQSGVAWQRLARGEDPRPLLPAVPEERFEQSLELEWPIEGLEPLSFVLGRLIEPLSTHLERRDRGAAVLHVRLRLVTRELHVRSLELPAPMRDARTLRTLALLDLESHPPSAAIDHVTVAVDPTPGRVVQFSLLTRPVPSPEQVSTLIARLDALMGPGRSGSPAEVDSWQPGTFAMTPFAPVDMRSAPHRSPHDARRPGESGQGAASTPASAPALLSALSATLSEVPASWPAPELAPGQASGQTLPPLAEPDAPSAFALRRFRLPVPARVRVEEGTPIRVTTDRRGLTGGHVERCAGPWRTSGDWWLEGRTVDVSAAGRAGGAVRAPRASWDRDEWDVALSDGATYRVFRERESGAWFIEGILD